MGRKFSTSTVVATIAGYAIIFAAFAVEAYGPELLDYESPGWSLPATAVAAGLLAGWVIANLAERIAVAVSLAMVVTFVTGMLPLIGDWGHFPRFWLSSLNVVLATLGLAIGAAARQVIQELVNAKLRRNPRI